MSIHIATLPSWYESWRDAVRALDLVSPTEADIHRRIAEWRHERAYTDAIARAGSSVRYLTSDGFTATEEDEAALASRADEAAAAADLAFSWPVSAAALVGETTVPHDQAAVASLLGRASHALNAKVLLDANREVATSLQMSWSRLPSGAKSLVARSRQSRQRIPSSAPSSASRRRTSTPLWGSPSRHW